MLVSGEVSNAASFITQFDTTPLQRKPYDAQRFVPVESITINSIFNYTCPPAKLLPSVRRLQSALLSGE